MKISRRLVLLLVSILIAVSLINVTIIYNIQKGKLTGSSVAPTGNVTLTILACGDLICSSGECISCPTDCTLSDCCGDGTCEPLVGETSTNCPVDCRIVPQPTPGGGGGGGAEAEKNIILYILLPPEINIYGNDTVQIPVIFKNIGEISLSGINILLEGTIPNSTITIDTNYIPLLNVNKEVLTYLRVKTGDVALNNYSITIVAKVNTPQLTRKAMIYFRVVERGIPYYDIRYKFRAAQNLFKQNPECLELTEFLKQAEEAMANNETAKAESLINAAIENCQNLISLRGRERPKIERPLNIPQIIAGSFVLLLIIVLIIIAYLLRPKKKEL